MTTKTINNKLFKYANKVLKLEFTDVEDMFNYMEIHDNKNTELLSDEWEYLDPIFL